VRLQRMTKMAYLLLAAGLQFAHFAQSRRTGRPKHARPLFESRHGGLHVLLLFLIFNDSCQAIISKSTRSICGKFSVLVKLWLQMILKLVFRSLEGRCRGKKICAGFIHRTDFHDASG